MLRAPGQSGLWWPLSLSTHDSAHFRVDQGVGGESRRPGLSLHILCPDPVVLRRVRKSEPIERQLFRPARCNGDFIAEAMRC